MRANLFTSNFKYIKVIIFILLLIPAIIFIGNEFEGASSSNIVNAHTKQRFEDFYNTPKNTIDVVFLGSSHSYCSFDPVIFDSMTGSNSFQMGTPLQHLDTSYYVFKEILNYQKPKVLVMDIYFKIIEQSFDLKQADSFFQVAKDENLKNDYINDVFSLGEKAKYFFKPIRYQQDYFAYKSKEYKDKIESKFNVHLVEKKQEGVEKYSAKGFIYCDYGIPSDKYGDANQFTGYDGRNFDIDNNQKKYLDKIIQLCEDNNIKIVFVTSPIANISMEKIKYYDKVNQKIAQYSEENNIPYIDYNIVNMNENLLKNSNFRDDSHLNYSGVVIVNKHFVNWLIDGGIFDTNWN